MADPAAPDDRSTIAQGAAERSASASDLAPDGSLPVDEVWDDAFAGDVDRPVPESPAPVPPQVRLSIFQQQARCVVGPCRHFFEVAGPRYAQPPGVVRHCMLSNLRLPGDQDADGLPIPLRCETWDPVLEVDVEARETRRGQARREEQAFKQSEETP